MSTAAPGPAQAHLSARKPGQRQAGGDAHASVPALTAVPSSSASGSSPTAPLSSNWPRLLLSFFPESYNWLRAGSGWQSPRGGLADLEGGQSLLRFLLRAVSLHFVIIIFQRSGPLTFRQSLFTMGLLHQPLGPQTLSGCHGNPQEGSGNLMPVTTGRLLVHLLAATGEIFQGCMHWNPFWATRGLSLNWLASHWPLLILGRTLLTQLGRAKPPT